MGPQGIPIKEDYAKFNFRWNKGHFLIEPKDFTFMRSDLSPDEVADYDKLVTFLGTFSANLLEDSERNALLDDN
ncbi:hypothetical protein A2U01_0065654, partial [Trifolium medium]|nr:hypothetical protein [Trifolium medium]